MTIRGVGAMLACGLLIAIVVPVLALAWLRWDAGRDRTAWFDDRQGTLRSAEVSEVALPSPGRYRSASVHLTSNTGLRVYVRVLRAADNDLPLPALVLLGGHRTGSDAIDLFDDIGDRSVIALDYPYEGPDRVRGFSEFAKLVPRIRQAFLDLPPAISLTLDWLRDQPWVDENEIAIAGVSLGVPFATTAAARDERVGGLLLVHGAADNRLWLQQNLARRIEAEWVQPAMATFLHWLVYGPVFDTTEHVAAVSPRPVVIVGARHDARTSEDQTRKLFEAAREPKKLRWTEGGHVGPRRGDIIDAIVQIADEEFPPGDLSAD